MKSINEALKYDFQCLDGRDKLRFSEFLTIEQIEFIGLEFKSKEAKKQHKPKRWTRQNILRQLKKDVAFGFQKALDQRGISSAFMYACVLFWNRMLEDGLENWDETNYAQYGLPLFKATAIKYGWDNLIGDDCGSEFKYSENYYG